MSACLETSPCTATAVPPRLADFVDHLVGARFAGGVVDHHGRAVGGELPGDGGADALGGTRHDRDLAGEFLNWSFHVCFVSNDTEIKHGQTGVND